MGLNPDWVDLKSETIELGFFGFSAKHTALIAHRLVDWESEYYVQVGQHVYPCQEWAGLLFQ